MKVRVHRRGYNQESTFTKPERFNLQSEEDVANYFVSSIQQGDGFLSKISQGISKVGSKLGLTNANWRAPPDPRGTEYEGTEETHLPGANYCGPGTYLKLRLARGDKPTSYADEVSLRHDISYQAVSDGIKNGTITSMEEVERLIREADNTMLRELKNSTDFKKSAMIRNFVIHKIIYAKTKLENLKLLHAKQFVNTDALNQNNETVMVNNDPLPMETVQEGSGIDLPPQEEPIMSRI